MTDGPDRAESRRRYDRMAAGYDRDLGQPGGRFGSRYMEAARKRAIGALQLEVGQTVVDLGCGTGASFARLTRAVGAQGRVIGVDQSRGMLDVARQRIADNGWTNVELIEAPAEEAELPSADAAVLFFVHDLLQTPSALDNVVAAVRPAGRIVAAGLQRASSGPLRLLLPARFFMRRYITSDESLDQPAELLAQRLDAVSRDSILFGMIYIVAGVRRAARIEATSA